MIFCFLFWHPRWVSISLWKAHVIASFFPFLIIFCLVSLFLFFLNLLSVGTVTSQHIVSHINLSWSPYEMSTIPEVWYVNIWELSKLNFRDPKKLKMFFISVTLNLYFLGNFQNVFVILQHNIHPPSTVKIKSLFFLRVLDRRVSETFAGWEEEPRKDTHITTVLNFISGIIHHAKVTPACIIARFRKSQELNWKTTVEFWYPNWWFKC